MVMKYFFERFSKKQEPIMLAAPEKSAASDDDHEDWEPYSKSYEDVGTSGVRNYSGYIYEDYLHKMRGRERADVFDRMRRSDPNVQMCLLAVKNPIKSATWTISAGSEESKDQEIAELIRHILFKDMAKTWKETVGEVLTVVDFGHCLLEVIHKNVVDHNNFGSYTGIANLAFRSARSIDRWNINHLTERLVSVTQVADGDAGGIFEIPAEFLLLFTLNKEGPNYEGISMLRPCYGNWLRKNNAQKMNAAGIEKYAIPTPIGTIPKGMDSKEGRASLERVLKAYTSHQKNYIIKPEGWNIELQNNSTYDPSKVDSTIDREDVRMTKAFLANFLELGMGSTGSFALSNDLSDFFLGGLVHIADEICEKFNRLIKALVILNYGPQEKYPTLTYTDLNDKAGKELAEILGILVSNQIVIADDPLEDAMRVHYKLPVRSEEGQRKSAQPSMAFSDRVKQKLRKIKWQGRK